jgi:hypothetical protein
VIGLGVRHELNIADTLKYMLKKKKRLQEQEDR